MLYEQETDEEKQIELNTNQQQIIQLKASFQIEKVIKFLLNIYKKKKF